MHWYPIKERNKSTSPCLTKRESRFEFPTSCSVCLPSSVGLLYVSQSLRLVEGWFVNLCVPVSLCVYLSCRWLPCDCVPGFWISLTKGSLLSQLNCIGSFTWGKGMRNTWQKSLTEFNMGLSLCLQLTQITSIIVYQPISAMVAFNLYDIFQEVAFNFCIFCSQQMMYRHYLRRT